ncbi:MAG: hypothetical protein PUD42_07435, partial [Clostridiales bacterium]|nr:hypothetical protein [Clostridiales bacterium]
NLTVNGNKVILPCDENYAQETAIKTMTPKSDLTSIDDKDIVMTEDDNKECHSKNYSAFTFEAGHNYSYGFNNYKYQKYIFGQTNSR